MSRKHYVAIAAALRARLDSGSSKWAIADVAHDIARIASADNPRFDRARFMQACGLDAAGNPPA